MNTFRTLPYLLALTVILIFAAYFIAGAVGDSLGTPFDNLGQPYESRDYQGHHARFYIIEGASVGFASPDNSAIGISRIHGQIFEASIAALGLQSSVKDAPEGKVDFVNNATRVFWIEVSPTVGTAQIAFTTVPVEIIKAGYINEVSTGLTETQIASTITREVTTITNYGNFWVNEKYLVGAARWKIMSNSATTVSASQAIVVGWE